MAVLHYLSVLDYLAVLEYLTAYVDILLPGGQLSYSLDPLNSLSRNCIIICMACFSYCKYSNIGG